ncbi:4-phosphopantetheinyl transferase [Streptacidiphilus pinicola]|uniref:4-phosphopantetheinyl transferase n=1 Tax=Streptacidiphilus pinicola TaxID=2219663 RepID=A0A2X0IIW4_9ACTN|nr:4'-phosphopantetheinyl transferase superfamily protein [Streptacidiphilus pinicola]RAG85054.1 4-phosphopantetheinyl transferase [Streptacidiphilus pinicola]
MTPNRSTHTTALPASAAGTSRLPGSTASCHVWALAPLSRPSSWFGLLDSTEVARCSSFRQEADLARFVTGRVLAKTALAFLVGSGPEAVRLLARCPDCGGPHGKPRVLGAAEGWELSISHSDERVVVAVSEGVPLGVDIERFEPWQGSGLPPEYDLVLTAAERAALDRIPQERRARAALSYWTRKEAVLKATGEGLNTPMTDFSLSGPDQPPVLLGWHPADGGRPVPAIADIALDADYHAAVAALGVSTVLPTVHESVELLPLLPAGVSAGGPAPDRLRSRVVRVLSTEVPRTPDSSGARSQVTALV